MTTTANQTAATNHRATTTAELDAIMDRMFSEESEAAGHAFRPRPTDIFITPAGKSGTTWLQQIAHGLRTGGSMDFVEITAVTPWPAVAQMLGWDLEAEQVANPRLYKSHDTYDEINKGARYIVAVRHPLAAQVSAYRFFEGWLFEPGSIGLEEFVAYRWPRETAGERGWWRHFSSWWEQRENPNVLLLCYEDMVADHPGTVRRVARFMGLADDDPAIDIATRQSTREFMLAHANQFDDSYMRAAAERRAGVPPRGQSFKVTTGDNSPDRYHITPAMSALVDAIWQEQITPRWGFADYAEARQALGELARSRPT